jgi:LPS sulfotransferase NodH
MLVEKAAITRPIFIVGTMRSGTTLLAEMLNRSPHIAHCPFELKDLWSEVGGIPMASAKTRDLICPECSAKDMRPDQRESLAASFLQRMATCVGKAPGATFLNKNPHLSNKLTLVSALFPDARFIWIHRDLPQVVASIKRLFADVCQRQGTWHWWPYPSGTMKNRCWNAFHSLNDRPDVPSERIFPGGDIKFIAEYWVETNRAISEFLKTTHNETRVKVAEESLIADPSPELARVAAKLQLPIPVGEHVKASIDRTRNQQWPELLNQHQLETLTAFVQAHANEFDGLFQTSDLSFHYYFTLSGAARRRQLKYL